MKTYFRGFDLANFWEESEYGDEEYTEAPPTPEMIASVEKELGYRLPPSYVALMKTRNGGIPVNTNHPTTTRTSWAEDHVAITGIMGIGRDKTYSLCGELGSPFMQAEWGYPKIGICICDCPSAGHDMIMLDYRKCGPRGEPEVVHVDQEGDYEITFLAKDFETFIRGLVNGSVYDTSAEDLRNDLKKIESGECSALLQKYVAHVGNPDFERILRNVCRKLTTEKGYFAVHADELSHLVYDILFFLTCEAKPVKDLDGFLKVFEKLFIHGPNENFVLSGIAPDFITDWMKGRMREGKISVAPSGALAMSEGFVVDLLRRVEPFQ